MIMKILYLLSYFLFLSRVISETETHSETELASSPPRGWNSYDSFCWTISEEEFLQNAQLVANRLHVHGYEYVVVDYLWYRKKVKGAYVDSLGFDVIDEWGRMVPDPGRWPSSRGGKGFTEVAKKVHAMGLKFGIHVMRGISTQAFNANTPILDIDTGRAYEESGRQWYAKDVGIKERSCAWMQNGFMSVNTKSGAGRAFLRSLYQQYADWGVDFVKHDCVFGDDLDLDEITFVSEVLRKLNRPILYSLSPGSNATPTMAKDVSHLVNMYRITGDDWDKWEHVESHFDVTRDFSAANMIGTKSMQGKSWPDLDMLPLGWLTDPGSNEGPHRYSNLTLDEQRTQMTLWSMAKSPLMFGGDVRKLDTATFSLITNPTLLKINSFSSNNKEFPFITGKRSRSVVRYSGKERNTVALKAPVLGLTSCKETKARGWSKKALDDDLEQICWQENSRSERCSPFCLFKKKPLLTTDKSTIYKNKYDDQVHLLATKTMDFCLGASSYRKLTSEESERGSFSPCKWDANQMWQLNYNGTLRNSYSGQCATVNQVKAASGGIRSWIATGQKGEVYVAFFNLDPEKTRISTKVSDIAKALPGQNFSFTSCIAKEVWSGRNFGIVKDAISAEVEKHGCALFVLNCS